MLLESRSEMREWLTQGHCVEDWGDHRRGRAADLDAAIQKEGGKALAHEHRRLLTSLSGTPRRGPGHLVPSSRACGCASAAGHGLAGRARLA